MSAKEYRFEPWARVFFGTLIALFWGACILGLASEDVRNNSASLLSVGFLFLLTLPLVDCMLWRLRVDKRGVTQTVYGWNVFWPWEVFGSGAVEKDDKGSYNRADWPWWRIGRKLHISLEPEDREEVESLFDGFLTDYGVKPHGR